MIARQLLASVLIGLLAAPAWCGADPAIGTAGPSEAATVRGNSLAPETALFSGDIVDVGAGGAATLNLGNGSVVRLNEKTTLRLEKGDKHVAFELLRGRVSFRSAEEYPVEAHLGGVRIRSANGQAAGAVAFRSSKVVAISAEKGSLLISTTREARNISLGEGKSMEMRVDAPQGGENLTNAPALQARSPWLAIAGLAGALGVVIGVAVAKGERRLSDQQKQNLVPVPFPPR